MEAQGYLGPSGVGALEGCRGSVDPFLRQDTKRKPSIDF